MDFFYKNGKNVYYLVWEKLDLDIFDLEKFIEILFDLEKMIHGAIWFGNIDMFAVWFRKIMYNYCLG